MYMYIHVHAPPTHMSMLHVLTVDCSEGYNASSASSDDTVKQLSNPPASQSLQLTQNLDLDQTPNPAPVQRQNTISTAVGGNRNPR